MSFASFGCILLNFYIKPQPAAIDGYRGDGCILLNFYIKPQLPLQIIV